MTPTQPIPRPLSEAEVSLESVLHLQFDRAKRFAALRIIVQIISVAAGVLSFGQRGSTVVPAVAVVAIVSQLASLIFSSKLQESREEAREALRALVLAYGLGVNPYALGSAQAMAGEGLAVKDGRQRYGFYCTERPSYAAMLRVIQELSFYLGWLSRRCGELMWALLAAASILFVAAVAFAVSGISEESEAVVVASRFAIAFIIAIATGDAFGKLRDYQKAASEFGAIDAEIDRLLVNVKEAGRLNRAAVWLVALRFFGTSAAMPLIPWKIHQRHRDRLRMRWQERPHHLKPIQPHED